MVLPFVNMSADPENEYFSDGITEEIINVLTTVKGLKVITRTSSFAFKNKNIDVRTIGHQIRENFGHLNIQEHLIEAPTKNIEAYDLYL